MSIPRPIDTGSIDRRLRAVESAVKAQDGARRLAAATISEGGLTIVDGGGIVLSGGGELEWRDSENRQRFLIREGANVDDTVSVTMRDADGTIRVLLGMMYATDTGEPSGEGILVDDADGTDLFSARPGRIWLRSIGGNATMLADHRATVEAGEHLLLYAGESAVVEGRDGNATLRASEDARVYGSNSAYMWSYGSDGQVSIGAESGPVWITAGSNFTMRTDSDSHRIRSSGNDVIVDAPNRLYVAANLTATGNLSIQGDKNFVIEHPTRQGRALIHSSTESPMAGIEYTGTAELNDAGAAVVNLPEYFEALAADDSRTVHLTPVGRPFMVGADPVEGGKFTAYGDPGRSVSWLVKARRAGMEYDAEPLIEDSPIAAPSEA